MDYVFIQIKGDYEAIGKHKESLKDITLDELVDKYNSTARLGIVGVREQARYIIALHQEFFIRIGESPVSIEENMIISLNGTIKLMDNKIIYENN